MSKAVLDWKRIFNRHNPFRPTMQDVYKYINGILTDLTPQSNVIPGGNHGSPDSNSDNSEVVLNTNVNSPQSSTGSDQFKVILIL